MDKDNQQGSHELIKEFNIAWLAGILNGDGCFSLTARKRPGKKSVNVDLSITLTQTDATIIEKAVGIVENIIDANPHIQEYAPCGSGINTKINMRISRMEHILKLLTYILPYLVGNKAARARMIKKYIVRRISMMNVATKNKNPFADDKSWELVEEYYRLTNREFSPEIMALLRD